MIVLLIVLLLTPSWLWAQNNRSVVVEEFVGPFSTWKNVKTDYGAVGTGGATDDTAEFQAALNALGSAGVHTLYIPAGTYNISCTLVFNDRIGVRIVGENPVTTILKWTGAAGGILLDINGVAYAALSRVTLDGSSLAGVLVNQSYDGSGGHFDTGNLYGDMIFKDAGTGIQGGARNNGFAETTVERVDFLRLFVAGITLGNFNALDLYVWDSYFEGCAQGVTNAPGAGNYRVNSSVFRGSTLADLRMGNVGVSSARFNTSIGSYAFYLGEFTRNPNAMVLHGNTILDPTSTVTHPVHDESHGPMILMDNVVRSLSGATLKPVYVQNVEPSADLLAVGNTYTIASPHSGSARKLDVDTAIVTAASLSGLTAPALPAWPVPASPARPLYTATSASDIQVKITAAQAQNGNRPLVHMPAGTYNIASTITIPAGSDVQLVGDGYLTTILTWTGSPGGTVLALPGPSKATLRDFEIDANGSIGIAGTNLNQLGGHVYTDNLELRDSATNNWLVERILDTTVEARNFSTAAHTSGTVVAVKVNGAKLQVHTAASSGQTLSWAVENGGQLLVRDTWYEHTAPGFLALTSAQGTLTLDSLRVAVPPGGTPPAIQLTTWNGLATLLGLMTDDRIVVAGSGSAAQVLGGGLVWQDPSDLVATPYANTASPPADMRLFGSREKSSSDSTGSHAVTNIGTETSAWITAGLAQTRSIVPQHLAPTATGVTDLRLFHVWVADASIGVHLQGETPLDMASCAPVVLRRARLVPCATFAGAPAVY